MIRYIYDIIKYLSSNGVIFYSRKNHQVYVADEVIRILRKIRGKDVSEKAKQINKHYLPNIIIAGSVDENNGPLFKNRFVDGETLIYVCKNNTCKLPIKDIKIAIELLNKNE